MRLRGLGMATAVAGWLGLAFPAHALMIGTPQSTTELGAPLRMRIPVRLDPGQSLPAECVQVTASAGGHGQGIGPLSVDAQPSDGGVTIAVQGRQPLIEPILTVRLHLGCQIQRTQVYTLLVDPPRPELPMTQGTMSAPVPPAPAATPTRPAVNPRPLANAPKVGEPSANGRPAAEAAPDERREPHRAPEVSSRRTGAESVHRPRPAARAVPTRHRPQPATPPKTRHLEAPTGVRLEMDWLAPDAIPAPQLRVATELSSVGAPSDAARRAELLQLQQLLVDSAAAPGASQPTLQTIDTLRTRESAMQSQLAAAVRERDAARAELERQKATSYSSAVVIALLGALLLMALLALWLWRRGRGVTLRANDVFGGIYDHPATADADATLPAGPRTEPAGAVSQQPQAPNLMSAVSPFGLPAAAGQAVPQPRVELPAGAVRVPPAAPDTTLPALDWDSRFMQPLTQGELLQVDELMDAGHLAEYFIDMGDDERAMALLEKSLDDSMADSFALPYLLLFDLYRRHGKENEYRTLHSRFQRRFNVHVPEWGAPPPEGQRNLLDYDRAMGLIDQHWGAPHIVTVLERMLLDDPRKPRMGFDLPAYRDLLMLYAVARDLFPDHVVPPVSADVQPEALDLDFELPIEQENPALPAAVPSAGDDAGDAQGSGVFQIQPPDDDAPRG